MPQKISFLRSISNSQTLAVSGGDVFVCIWCGICQQHTLLLAPLSLATGAFGTRLATRG